MLRPLPPLAAFLLLALAGPARAGTLVLDAMTDLLVPNPCLSSTARPIVFAGRYCDGTTCPPGDFVSHDSMYVHYDLSCDYDHRDGLPGVLGGDRDITVHHPIDGSSVIAAEVLPAEARTVVTITESSQESDLTLTYIPFGYGWNYDFSQVTAVRVVVTGDIDPDHPLLWYFVFMSSDVGLETSSAYTLLTAPGEVVVPISSFTVSPQFNFSKVEGIQTSFSNCTDSTDPFECPGPYPAQNYSIGPIVLDTSGPTSARRTSFGALKLLYR